jgi:iron complex transport system substrate-binding protein
VRALILWGLAALAAAPSQPEYLGPKPNVPARRVVTLAPSLTELVLALGKTDALVGVSRFDELPQVAKLPRVGGYVDPSVEAVLALKPDLVLVQPSPGNQRPVEKVAELGISVLALPLRDVEDVLKAFRVVGEALGAIEAGEGLARKLETTRVTTRGAAKALQHPRVLFVYGFSPLVVAGPGSFAHELLLDAGGLNVAESAPTPYPVFSVERALALRPDLVVDAADTAEGREAMRNLPGLKEAKWVRLPSQSLLHPGPNLAQGLKELFLLLHPRQ